MTEKRVTTTKETTERDYADTLRAFAELLAEKVNQKVELEEKLRYEKFAHEHAIKQVDDLAQELAVTQSQLEEARKRLERYEGGGN